jgi:hypothetical protein
MPLQMYDSGMTHSESFAPENLKEEAAKSGFFQCPTCGLVWFGLPEINCCPGDHPTEPVHVAVLCRFCDITVPIVLFADHLATMKHDLGGN